MKLDEIFVEQFYIKNIDFVGASQSRIIRTHSLLKMCLGLLFIYENKTQSKLIYLLLCIPIIFICVLIYCPNGLYFLIMKGPFIYTPDFEYEKNWVYGIYISIEFFIVQLIPITIVREIQTSSKPDPDEQNEQTDEK